MPQGSEYISRCVRHFGVNVARSKTGQSIRKKVMSIAWICINKSVWIGIDGQQNTYVRFVYATSDVCRLTEHNHNNVFYVLIHGYPLIDPLTDPTSCYCLCIHILCSMQTLIFYADQLYTLYHIRSNGRTRKVATWQTAGPVQKK